jgi:hypothetical protein
MSKHTPGPWQIDWYICREKGKELWRVPRSIGPACADHDHWAGNHITVDAADAHLIAAAPDLLDALLRLLNDGDVRDAAEKGALTQARAAIAKATGEQP